MLFLIACHGEPAKQSHPNEPFEYRSGAIASQARHDK